MYDGIFFSFASSRFSFSSARDGKKVSVFHGKKAATEEYFTRVLFLFSSKYIMHYINFFVFSVKT